MKGVETLGQSFSFAMYGRLPYICYLKEIGMSNATKTRVDIRLAKKQKEYFEYAAKLGGFKTLTDFVIFSGEQQANQIVEKHNTILASKRDQEVFFDALINPQPANERLRKAAIRYKELTSKKQR